MIKTNVNAVVEIGESTKVNHYRFVKRDDVWTQHSWPERDAMSVQEVIAPNGPLHALLEEVLHGS